jgi:hypothetical protein
MRAVSDWYGAYIVISKPHSEANEALAAIPYETLLEAYAGSTDTPISENALRLLYSKWLMMIYEAYSGNRRDGDRWRIKGHDVVVSGGESFGQPPTDLCHAIWMISFLDICE